MLKCVVPAILICLLPLRKWLSASETAEHADVLLIKYGTSDLVIQNSKMYEKPTEPHYLMDFFFMSFQNKSYNYSNDQSDYLIPYLDSTCNIGSPQLPGCASSQDLNEPPTRHSLRTHCTHVLGYLLQRPKKLTAFGLSFNMLGYHGLELREPVSTPQTHMKLNSLWDCYISTVDYLQQSNCTYVLVSDHKHTDLSEC